MDPTPYVTDISAMDLDSGMQHGEYGYEALYSVEFVDIEELLAGDAAADGYKYKHLHGTYGVQTEYGDTDRSGYDSGQWLSGGQDGYGQSQPYDPIDGYGFLEVSVSYQGGSVSDQYKPGYDGQTYGSGQSGYSSQSQTYDPIEGYGFLDLTVSYNGSYQPSYNI